MAVFTTRLNLAKPAGGSSGTIPGDDQADIDVLNDNSDKIDAAIGVAPVTSGAKPATPFSGQPIALTDANNIGQLRVGSAWVNPGYVGFGTTAQRDAYYPTPGNAAARVALAATAPRWFNTDKGFMQQYFAQFDDAGVAAPFAKKVFGWRAAIDSGRVPIAHAFTVSGGTPANVKKYGNTVQIDGGTSDGIIVNGCFIDDFDVYEIEIEIPTVPGGTNLSLQFRNAGAIIGAGLHDSERIAASGGTASAINQGSANLMDIGTPSTGNGCTVKMRVYNSRDATIWTRVLWEGGATGLNWLSGAGTVRVLATQDGFNIGNGSAWPVNTRVRIWGLSNGV